MKKTLSFLVLGALVLGMALPASAQMSASATTTSDLLAQLQSLQSQLLSVRAQLATQLGIHLDAKKSDKRIPPGITKRLEKGKDLPKGILKKIENNLEYDKGRMEREEERREKRNTPDLASPNLFGVTAIQVTKDSSRIIWATDERSDSKVWMGTTSPVVTTGAAAKSSASLSFFHDLTLTGLASSTTYHYVIGSTDASGNMKASGAFSFTTSAQ